VFRDKQRGGGQQGGQHATQPCYKMGDDYREAFLSSCVGFLAGGRALWHGDVCGDGATQGGKPRGLRSSPRAAVLALAWLGYDYAGGGL
jgi:hypothetical protein